MVFIEKLILHGESELFRCVTELFAQAKSSVDLTDMIIKTAIDQVKAHDKISNYIRLRNISRSLRSKIYSSTSQLLIKLSPAKTEFSF